MSDSCSDSACSSCASAGTCSSAPKSLLAEAHPSANIQHVIAVMSGKGGVGKSSVAALLATHLQQAGYQVGLLDADITGPSIPKMFGITGKLKPHPAGMLPNTSSSGIKVMSINLLLENEDDPVIWRGPVIGGVIRQFWTDVLWGDLDYLLVDLPPGTGDAPLTVMQLLPLEGIVIVTSPQDLALMVVKKAIKMAQAMEKPILGVIENMAYALCPHCGERLDLFGVSKTVEIVADLGYPFLGSLPLDPQIATLCDQGRIEDLQSPLFAQAVQTITKR